ncbi:hypothetical protein JTB14_009941 [Gonioctena quinquepunctata]|nr:hypothetical protein JTB14_009941 [Gonioctena quinquepunctata]
MRQLKSDFNILTPSETHKIEDLNLFNKVIYNIVYNYGCNDRNGGDITYIKEDMKYDYSLIDNEETTALELNIIAFCNGGRKQKNFIELSDRSKRRKTQELRNNLETVELTYAAKMKLRADGNVAAAKILDDITNSGPECATSYIKVSEVRNNRLTEDKALSLLTEAKLTSLNII